MAVKILGPKYGFLSYRYSKMVRLDWFNGVLLQEFLDLSWRTVCNLSTSFCHEFR